MNLKEAYASGTQIYLRAPTYSDAKGDWCQWLNDSETTKWLIDRFWPNSKKDQISFYKESHIKKTALILSIVDIKTHKHIGVCSLSSINWVHRYADIALIIGDKNFRSGTIALESIRLLLGIAFDKLNLENIKGAYVEGNKYTPSLLGVFKFNRIGRYKNLCKIKGQKHDLVLVQLSSHKWRNLRKCE